jgi:hypothetical protein
MPFYLKKSFSSGPVRLNLSKSGLGVSLGTKGLRIGIGPRGSYIHGGRKGLYYRQQLSSSGRSESRGSYSGGFNDPGFGCFMTILMIIGIVLIIMLVKWITTHSTVVLIGVGIVVAILVIFFIFSIIKTIRENKEKRLIQNKLDDYKEFLDRTFILPDQKPLENAISYISSMRDSLSTSPIAKGKMVIIENNVYHAILDKVLDDKYVSEEESKTIKLAESILKIDPETKDRIKKEIFSAAYLQVIDDKLLTKAEISLIENLTTGLNIPDELIREEKDLFYDLVRSQEIQFPLPEIPASMVPINLSEKETVNYITDAKILELRRLERNDLEESYVTIREGTLVITNKRIVLSDKGSTNILLADIAYIDVDLDTKLIEVTKSTSRKPIYIHVDSPFIVARIIDWVM